MVEFSFSDCVFCVRAIESKGLDHINYVFIYVHCCKVFSHCTKVFIWEFTGIWLKKVVNINKIDGWWLRISYYSLTVENVWTIFSGNCWMKFGLKTLVLNYPRMLKNFWNRNSFFRDSSKHFSNKVSAFWWNRDIERELSS